MHATPSTPRCSARGRGKVVKSEKSSFSSRTSGPLHKRRTDLREDVWLITGARKTKKKNVRSCTHFTEHLTASKEANVGEEPRSGRRYHRRKEATGDKHSHVTAKLGGLHDLPNKSENLDVTATTGVEKSWNSAWTKLDSTGCATGASGDV